MTALQASRLRHWRHCCCWRGIFTSAGTRCPRGCVSRFSPTLCADWGRRILDWHFRPIAALTFLLSNSLQRALRTSRTQAEQLRELALSLDVRVQEQTSALLEQSREAAVLFCVTINGLHRNQIVVRISALLRRNRIKSVSQLW